MLNKVILQGEVSKDSEYLFTTKSGREKYQFYVDCKRESGTVDRIPVISYASEIKAGERVSLSGIYTSYNQQDNGKMKLKLAVKADEMEFIELDFTDLNEIELEGIVCKKPVLRETPFGRTIADVLIAVNRDAYNYSDYIPLIFWGYCAVEANKLQIGDCIKIKGRIQSRPYTKEDVEYVAYEVSAAKFEILGNVQK